MEHYSNEKVLRDREIETEGFLRIMLHSIIDIIREVWNSWDVPLFVLLSLSLQLILIWFASLRKRVSHQILHVLIWIAYLLADWAAAFTIGLIHNKGSNNGGDGQAKSSGSLLYSFWAPFLLVHLGGPDTITAFALEDNELWRRRLLHFLAQVIATGNIVYQQPPPALLCLPMALVFLCGLVKYGERIWALYHASMGKFRRSILRDPDPGPNYAMFMEEYAQKVDDHFPTRITTIEEPELEQELYNFEVRQTGLRQLQGHVQVVKDAYYFFERYKGLIVDFEYGFRDRNKTRQYFLSLEEADAVRVVETELSFIYDAFYTKSMILHQRGFYIVRSLCLGAGLISLGVFFFWDKKVLVHSEKYKELQIEPRHVNISYTLLLGAIALDLISLLMLIFSDWGAVTFLAKAEKYNPNKRMITFFNKEGNLVVDKLLAFKSRWFSAPPWSKSIHRFSLLNYYCHQREPKTNKLLDTLGIRLLLDGLMYVDTYRFNNDIATAILRELKMKSEQADDPNKAKELCSARGGWVLDSYSIEEVLNLREWVEVEYDESLLLWHIATDLCYNIDRTTGVAYNLDRNTSKALSDYMVYLLVLKPMMISNVTGIIDLRLQDTEAEALRFIRGGMLVSDEFELFSPAQLLSRSLMNVLITDSVRPRDVKGSRSKSVLFEACRLANRLLKIPAKVDRWEVMRRVWVELLCYAACHCRPINHAQHVSGGGELITVVWLLMTHLGLSEQFHLEDGPTRTKLVVEE